MKSIGLGVILFVFVTSTVMADDAAILEIINRYNMSLGKAKGPCARLSEQIDKVKLMAGIGIAAGVVGTAGGGIAVAAGILKANNDNQVIVRLERYGQSDDAMLEGLMGGNIVSDARDIEKQLNKESQRLGNIRTAGAFVAGGTGAAGAIASFSGTGALDKLIEDINACNTYIMEIERQKIELTFSAPDDPNIRQMDNIIQSCKGLDSKNIESVKSRLIVTGIVSAIGAAAGIAGGITSIIANNKDKEEQGNKMNAVANVSSGVAAVGNLGGAILSGVVLSGLIKNGDIATACAEAF